MGYTQYFPQNRSFTNPEWSKIQKTVKAIIASQPLDMICGGNGKGDPVVDSKMISFNGSEVDDRCHETFQITHSHDPNFNFCKTAEKEYDPVVVAVLCAIDHIAPGALTISSDGRVNEWAAGLEIARQVIPECKIPKGIKK